MQKIQMRHVGEPEHEDETPHVVMRHYVICAGTSDYPGKFTVRKHLVFSGRMRPAELMGVVDTLELARKLVPPGMTRIPPDPRDDPVIKEVWL